MRGWKSFPHLGLFRVPVDGTSTHLDPSRVPPRVPVDGAYTQGHGSRGHEVEPDEEGVAGRVTP